MLKDTFSMIRQNVWVFTTIFVVIVGLPFVLERSFGSSKGIAVGLVVGYISAFNMFMQARLAGVPLRLLRSHGKPSTLWGFMFRTLLILALAGVPVFALTIYFVTSFDRRIANVLMVFVASPLLYISLSVFLSLLGTWLPATIEGRASFSQALVRGQRHFWFVFWRFSLVCALPGFILDVAPIFAFVLTNSEYSPSIIALITFRAAFEIFGLIYISVVLVDLYRSCEAEDAASEAEDAAVAPA
ncbi:hypothetical protein FJU08_19200 [Martelella alba]|uniref:Uncharacterized protein n=1 Tax=Martelella alba TaxID=2590451 RepID=A0A506U3F1_9HYPH|nr:hypothetical protein [Martelella alba]TPW27856.1 hypothetical protein FJU08_19200 [Martelella alba]